MSRHDQSFGSAQDFVLTGPVISVQVEVPPALAASLRARKERIPDPVAGLALIDTGASTSAVDLPVIQQLGVQPISMGRIGTPTGIQTRPFFPGRFSFPGTTIPSMDFFSLLGADLSVQKVYGAQAPLIALIGRDILAHFVLVCDGPKGLFSLTR